VYKKYDTWKTRRPLGILHLPPTKVFPRLAVNKTILKPRIAAATGAQYLYVGFSRRNKFLRRSAYDIGESNLVWPWNALWGHQGWRHWTKHIRLPISVWTKQQRGAGEQKFKGAAIMMFSWIVLKLLLIVKLTLHLVYIFVNILAQLPCTLHLLTIEKNMIKYYYIKI